MVTLPFEEFQDKNGAGKLTPAAASSISGIGFWLNAIPDSAAVDADGFVSGTLIYDAVRSGYTENPVPTFEPVDFGADSREGKDTEEGMAKSAAEAALEDASLKEGSEPGRGQMIMIISGAVSLVSLVILLWLALGLRKKK